MKIVISENKFKNLINKYVGYDLTHRIEMITSWENLTGSENHNVFGNRKDVFNHYLNNYGPMYLFSNIQGHNYLVQKQEKQIWFIVNTSTGYEIDYYDFLSMLNIDMLGISLSEIINKLVEE